MQESEADLEYVQAYEGTELVDVAVTRPNVWPYQRTPLQTFPVVVLASIELRVAQVKTVRPVHYVGVFHARARHYFGVHVGGNVNVVVAEFRQSKITRNGRRL